MGYAEFEAHGGFPALMGQEVAFASASFVGANIAASEAGDVAIIGLFDYCTSGGSTTRT